MESKGMNKASVTLIVLAIGVLAVAIAVGTIFLNSNSSPTPTPTITPTPTLAATITTSPTLTNNPSATPTSDHTVTYSEQSRNQTMIVIQFKLEPNSYIFQLNATSFILSEYGVTVSANTNNPVIIGTQYATLYFPINGYNGTDYRLSSDALPPDTVWIKQ